MKWIGQHIWDYISRFRSDVYLESISTGTIASGGNLGLDSNNKIVKATEVGSSVDLTSAEVTGILTVDHGGTGLGTVGTNEILTGNGTSALTSESNLSFDGFTLSAGSSASYVKIGGSHTTGSPSAISDSSGTTIELMGFNVLGTPVPGWIKFNSAGSMDQADCYIEASHAAGTDKSGGDLILVGGASTGNDASGSFKFYGDAGGGGSDSNVNAPTLKFEIDGSGDITMQGDKITSAGTLTIQPADISGVAFHLDANADTDNEVQIDAGVLDIDVTGASTLDTTELTITSPKQNKVYDFNTTTFENIYATDQGRGTVIKYSPGDNTALPLSEIHYLRTNGSWAQADADVEAASKAILGIGLGAPQTVGVLIKGFVRVAYTEILNTPGSGAVDGLPVYLSPTAGHFDFTAPSSSGQFVRIVGYAIDDFTDSGNTDVLIWFDPDKTWIEVA